MWNGKVGDGEETINGSTRAALTFYEQKILKDRFTQKELSVIFSPSMPVDGKSGEVLQRIFDFAVKLVHPTSELGPR